MKALWLASVLLVATSAAAQDQRGPVETAVTQPLRDTRISDDRIPEVLQLAASAPYSTRGMASCAAIRAEIVRLDSALGPDADAPGDDPRRTTEIAAAATRLAVNTLIPGLGIARVVTGADRQQRRAEAAVHAGSIRRSFLKGLGSERRCRPPAAPTRAAMEARPTMASADR
jgi:hypothetical protein